MTNVIAARTTPIALIALLLLSLSACGELTSGGAGEVEVYTTADDPQVSPASRTSGQGDAVYHASEPSAAPASARAPSASIADGQLLLEAQAFVQLEGSDEWIELTDGVSSATLDLRGTSESRIAMKLISEGRYDRFRMDFRRVEANVTGGVLVDGAPLTGTVSVELGSQGSVSVERPMLLEVEAESRAALVVDLNAGAWLATASPLTRTVSAAAFSSVVSVRIR